MDVLTSIDLPGVRKFKSGKVREVFDLGDSLLFVATDRLSAFDCILPTGIPWKGHVLNQLSAWWFARLGHLCPHHVIETDFRRYPDPLSAHARLLRGRSMIVRKTRVIPVECVARGYLIGSGWKEYEQAGAIGGMRLRPGYRLADRLDDPIFTPARKAESGHDENVSFEDVMRETSPSLARRLRETTLTLYREAAAYALSRGIILADTKFEFGLDGDELVLIDEVLTPDSSRYWPKDQYRPGISPPSFDKQFVRDHLEKSGWNKQPPAPPLPPEVAMRTSEKYLEAFRLLTGAPLETR
jgi:phosphoribosylaminoimidazole-succinocarboxamide synthase